jgi:gamma-glutamylcyclotransferase (GGCT)/AIG2-like uncharacterized protein YtfP
MLVFVYGTLKRGFGNHGVMLAAGGQYVGNSIIKDYAAINVPWFPYAIKKVGSRIKGEVFSIEEKGLNDLDILEGYPSHYNRSLVETSYGFAWVYHAAENMTAKIKKYGFTEEWSAEHYE